MPVSKERYEVFIKALKILLCTFFLMLSAHSQAEVGPDFLLGAGDSIHITVFRNPDLLLDTRVNVDGSITYPLLGSIQIGGLSIPDAQEMIAKGLKDGGFMQDPQVNIVMVTVRGNLVSVLGQVNRPGLYPLDPANLRLSEVLALAGGIAQSGGEKVIVVGLREGKPYRREINLASIYLDNKTVDDIVMSGRDEIYVPLAPMFYIYGEVQRPGASVVLRDMTVIQALAQGGGLTLRGTERNIQIHRTKSDGKIEKFHPEMTERIQQNDVIYVHESLF